jgi:FlaA1/EpsC-like NDP-sugar epimerase
VAPVSGVEAILGVFLDEGVVEVVVVGEQDDRVGGASGRPIEVVYTGLRPGEKLHEELFGAGETDLRPLHPLISHVSVPPLDPALVRALDVRSSPAALTGALADLCVVPVLAIDVPSLSAARTR